MLAQAQHYLKQVYGFSSFRTGQEQIIQAVFDGNDILAILPTGAGKSICYQIPALVLQGTVIVISPLISLMKDQVDALRRLGVSCAYLNSSLLASEYREVISNALSGEYDLLYIAPERLDTPVFQQMLGQIPIPLIAIDEAHCVSQWGHDFRPSYRQLAEHIAKLPSRPRIAAFTATATPEAAEDIAAVLKLDHPEVFVTGFARPNLQLSVVSPASKEQFVKKFVQERKEQSGIIYTATRKETDEVHKFLLDLGIQTGKYHGGLNDREREEAQEKFRFGTWPVMVATNAFGMGIDKPDVRYVLHWQMPGDIESYYQEAGRAGRDGEDSSCILLFSASDIRIQRFLIEQSQGLQDYKENASEKLNTMINYCRTERCLQQFTAEYFGEKQVESCGKCSNCLDQSKSVDRTEEARMALSCVGRMRGRFGVTMVSKVLKGSKDKKLLQFRLHELSTYGLMKNLTEKSITDWLYWLIAEGYMTLSSGQYPLVSLTNDALPVLNGSKQVLQRSSSAVRQLTVSGNENLPAFEWLRVWRKQQAEEEQVPPFIVFSDAVLKEIAATLPLHKGELLQVKGIGSAKAEKYGEAILAQVQQFRAHHNMPNRAFEASGNKETTAVGEQAKHIAAKFDGDNKQEINQEQPSYIASYSMFQDGVAVEAIAELRGLAQGTVESHLLRAAEEGYAVDWDRLVDIELLSLITATAVQLETNKLKELKEALPEEISYFMIRAALLQLSVQ